LPGCFPGALGGEPCPGSSLALAPWDKALPVLASTRLQGSFDSLCIYFLGSRTISRLHVDALDPKPGYNCRYWNTGNGIARIQDAGRVMRFQCSMGLAAIGLAVPECTLAPRISKRSPGCVPYLYLEFTGGQGTMRKINFFHYPSCLHRPVAHSPRRISSDMQDKTRQVGIIPRRDACLTYSRRSTCFVSIPRACS
jgi:hypothetical protein